MSPVNCYTPYEAFRLKDIPVIGAGALAINPTAHFRDRWKERVDLDSSYYRVEMIEGRYLYLGAVGKKEELQAYHLLIKIKTQFFILVVANNGNIKTILDEKHYRRQIHAVNLSAKKTIYHKTFLTGSQLQEELDKCWKENIALKEKIDKLKKCKNVEGTPKEAIKKSRTYLVLDKKFRKSLIRYEDLQKELQTVAKRSVKGTSQYKELLKKYNDLMGTCVRLRRENNNFKKASKE